MSHPPVTPCIISVYKPGKRGYPRRRYQGRIEGDHRVAWIEANGPIPDGLWVLHRCDNKRCRNHEHLFLGTPLDNSRDMAEKRRSTIGERNRHAKLTWPMIDAIRSRNGTPAELAERFGVTRNTVYRVLNHRTWR